MSLRPTAWAVHTVQISTDQYLIFTGQAGINASFVLLGACPLSPHEDHNDDDDTHTDQCCKNTSNDGSNVPTILSKQVSK